MSDPPADVSPPARPGPTGRLAAVAVAVAACLLLAGCLGGPAPTPGTGTGTETTGPGPTATATADVPAGPTPPPPDAGDRGVVVDVVDGDTVEVRLENGDVEKIRLLGVDTPEVYAETTPGEYEGVPDTGAGRACLGRAGEAAGAFAQRRLAGEEVRLVYDPESDRRGYYGRLLAYVYVAGEPESFNYRLLAEGHARVFESSVTRIEEYRAAERAAREAGRGLWACAGDAGAVTTATTAARTAADGDGSVVVAALAADAPGNDNENLNAEAVTVRNGGTEPADLGGWTLSDGAGHVYTFPSVTLAPGESLRVHTGSGTDDPPDLYWGRGGAVWNNGGDVATLRRPDGTVVDRYEYP